MNKIEIIASYCNFQNEMEAKLLHLNQRAHSIQKTLEKCKADRKKHLQTILRSKSRIAIIANCLSKSRKRRSVWTLERYGAFWEKDVPRNDNAFFKKHFRIERSDFDTLVEKLKCLEKQDTFMRKCIPLEKRVAIGLFALGSSAEFRTVGSLFGVSKESVCTIFNEFCREVWRVLAPQYLPPNFLTEDKVSECVKVFEIMGFPQCIGAIDGCHIEVKPESADAVDYYNYKGWYSTNLFALVDYRYRFMHINVGTPGRCNDSNIFEQSRLKSMLQNDLLKTKSKKICGVDVPVVVLGDSAFTLSDSVMKPYPFSTTASAEQRAFNYALSKCRRVVENAFGHLKARFRRIGKGIDNKIDNVNAIIKCACVLHNFLNERNSAINQSWLEESRQFEAGRQNPTTRGSLFLADFNPNAQKIRSTIAKYLCSTTDEEQEGSELEFSQTASSSASNDS